jgi:hypothetical protein
MVAPLRQEVSAIDDASIARDPTASAEAVRALVKAAAAGPKTRNLSRRIGA